MNKMSRQKNPHHTNPIFSKEMYFIFVIAFVVFSLLIPDYRQSFLICALFCGLAFLWTQHRGSVIMTKVQEFDEEIQRPRSAAEGELFQKVRAIIVNFQKNPRLIAHSIFSAEMWFFLLSVFVIFAILAPPFRQVFLICALLSGAGFLWVDRRALKVMGRVEEFTKEIRTLGFFEDGKLFEEAKERYQTLLGKYRNIPEFSWIIKVSLQRLETGYQEKLQKTRMKQEEVIARQSAVEKEKIDSAKSFGFDEKKDRRRHPRYPVALTVGSITSMSEPGQSYEGQVKNLSLSGALIESLREFNSGDTVMISGIPLPENGELKDIFARVVRVAGPVSHLAGLEFLYMTDHDVSTIDCFLKKSNTQPE